MTQIIAHLGEVASRYDAVFCDLWGCLHNGKTVYPAAVSALQDFRRSGGKVVLLTNAARPFGQVAAQIEGLGAPRDCWDLIVTSGDAAQAALVSGAFGRKVYFIGPERDLSFFADADGRPFDIQRVSLDQADSVVCTGLVDDRTETVEDYRGILLNAKTRGLKLLCANPDIVVDVGDQRLFCAGALAQEYTRMGGESAYFGKPHPPIYDLARAKLTELTGETGARILCIGDGIQTDIQGGMGEDLDTLFVTGGLAAEETQDANGNPEPARLQAYLEGFQLSPDFAIGKLQ
jgi:HAD superfamily hydrolase (TIGR01459 family)